ncbi:MAG: 3D-(3,5/4)-trihydroxycyclohexane-1,2-dione acylhydrolase (decyclizing) [Terriglobales bacterium]
MSLRLTGAQAIVAFLKNQFVERDGREDRFFEACFGIFGHGNVAGMGQALEQDPGLRYVLCRNEQAMVHAAAAFAKMSNRKRAIACTTSIGPGATNMVTGAALATINRLPVLLLPGDIFSTRTVAPVLQQLEVASSQDVSVNDCFRPVSRYWDRINRPEQLLTTLPETMRVLTSPSETGAVTLCLPQDVQAEAFDFPEGLFQKRTWVIPRPLADRRLLLTAAQWIRNSRRPLIIAGGGVLYSEASGALAELVSRTGIPVCETQAGKGALPFNHEQQLGAIGVTGTPGANIAAREADLIIGIGTRYSDFTTASKTAFQSPATRFININIAEFDSHKQFALPLTSDARASLEELSRSLSDFHVESDYTVRINEHREKWEQEVDRIQSLRIGPPISQGEVIGIVNEVLEARDVLVCAAGSLPGDLHKLWRARDPKGYHVEYGYSCMGYEIAGGMGVKMAAPDREVYVMVGDGSYLMMAQEIVTAIQEGYKLNVILLDNHGFSSIGGLSRSCGNRGMGTEYRYRKNGVYDGDVVQVDFVANAASLGAVALRVRTGSDLRTALVEARKQSNTTVVVVETAIDVRVPGYESWWDVPIAEVSESEAVRMARQKYEKARQKERVFL